MSELVPKDDAPLIPAPTGIDGMIEKAITAGLDVETLERLLALKERHEASEARKAYYQALARFQRDCPVITRSKSADRYKYAPLSDIIAQVGTLESDCGLTHRFDQVMADDGSMLVTCHITHEDGHSESTTSTVPATQGRGTNSAQNAGIMTTYGMRYSFLGALGITTADEDMDGRLPQSAEPITVEQSWQLDALITETGADRDAFLRWAGVAELEELPAAKMKQALTLLHKKAAQS